LSFLFFFISGCGKLFHREVNCRAYQLKEEKYWFPHKAGDSVVFMSSLNETRIYKVADKSIVHRTKYYSDTGCGCEDIASMLLTSGEDSIWLKTKLRYIEDNTGNTLEDVVFDFGDIQSGDIQSVFYETHRTYMPSHTIDSVTFSDIKKFEFAYTNPINVKAVYMVKNTGIVRFEMVNGTIWSQTDIANTDTVSIESFEYQDTICY
jgi:hypothetical protein